MAKKISTWADHRDLILGALKDHGFSGATADPYTPRKLTVGAFQLETTAYFVIIRWKREEVLKAYLPPPAELIDGNRIGWACQLATHFVQHTNLKLMNY